MQWPLPRCIEMFRSTVKKVFVQQGGMVALARRLLRLHRAGAKYDTETFCNILRDVFGKGLMRESVVAAKRDVVRVAITSTTRDARLCLFRSYGDVLREDQCGDHIPKTNLDPPLWQA